MWYLPHRNTPCKKSYCEFVLDVCNRVLNAVILVGGVVDCDSTILVFNTNMVRLFACFFCLPVVCVLPHGEPRGLCVYVCVGVNRNARYGSEALVKQKRRVKYNFQRGIIYSFLCLICFMYLTIDLTISNNPLLKDTMVFLFFRRREIDL
uniref:Uncharacterized protein n=1 Tax=Oryza brachyantha TaxID=4533 RepID=J3KWE2_ORYBR